MCARAKAGKLRRSGRRDSVHCGRGGPAYPVSSQGKGMASRGLCVLWGAGAGMWGKHSEGCSRELCDAKSAWRW
eukprot:4742411-Prymnesium_polylepis.1